MHLVVPLKLDAQVFTNPSSSQKEREEQPKKERRKLKLDKVACCSLKIF